MVTVTNDNGGALTPEQILASVSSTLYGLQTVTGTASGTEMEMSGEYTVTAPDQTNYTKTLSEDCTGELASLDDSATCTIAYNDVAQSTGGGGGGGSTTGGTGGGITTDSARVFPSVTPQVLGEKIADPGVDEEVTVTPEDPAEPPAEVLGYQILPVTGIDYTKYIVAIVAGILCIAVGLTRRRETVL